MFKWNTCGGLKVSALNSGSSGPGSSPSQGHCVVFVGKALKLHSALSPPRSINGYQRQNAGQGDNL